MKTSRKKAISSLFILSLMALLLGWSTKALTQDWKAEWEKTLAQAKKEGRVAVAGGVGESYRNAAIGFQKSYPDIQLDYVGVQGRDFAPRVVQERRAGQFLWDVHIGGATSIMTGMVPHGAVDPLRPALILPEVLEDSKWRSGFNDGWMEKDAKYVYGFSGSVHYAIFINRDLVPESEFNKAQDLWNPKWKGKIVWHEPRAGGSGAHQGLLILLNYGEDALRRLLRDQGVVITEDYRQQVEWVAQGRYPVAIGLLEIFLRPFQKEGVGKNIKPLKENKLATVIGAFGHVGLLNRAPHPNAAKVFINWLLSKEGQTAWVKATGDNSRRVDVPVGDPEFVPEPGAKYLNTQKQEYAEMVKNTVNPIAKEMLK